MRFSKGSHKTLSSLSKSTIPILVIALLLQIGTHQYFYNSRGDVNTLDPPFNQSVYDLIYLGEHITAAYISSIWLQSFDNQPGIRLPYSALDYNNVSLWLTLIESLSEKSNYPQLLAAYSYASIPYPNKQRIMLEYIQYSFKRNPAKNWRWLAHAAIIAKHDLNDLPLALEYATDLQQLAQRKEIPYWVKDLPIVFLENMGKNEAARILVGGLMANGEIQDPFELAYLQQKFDELSSKQ